MTRDEITAIALSIWPTSRIVWQDVERLERFAALVAAKERARCADIARRTVCDVHTPTGIKIYGTKAAKAIMEGGA